MKKWLNYKLYFLESELKNSGIQLDKKDLKQLQALIIKVYLNYKKI